MALWAGVIGRGLSGWAPSWNPTRRADSLQVPLGILFIPVPFFLVLLVDKRSHVSENVLRTGMFRPQAWTWRFPKEEPP